jgi:hypothetical protein
MQRTDFAVMIGWRLDARSEAHRGGAGGTAGSRGSERQERTPQDLSAMIRLDGAMAWRSEPPAHRRGLRGCPRGATEPRSHPPTSSATSWATLAGADIIETNTFGANALVLAEYGLEAKAREINAVAARLAADLARAASTAAKPRFVAGSMGPTTKAITVTGGVTFPELVTQFRDQAAALVEAWTSARGTRRDTRNTKAALIGIRSASTRWASGCRSW